MAEAPGGAVRSDARRNRARVLDAATRAFTERGVDVSLLEIARAAGVGVGTVYRHFPSKETLVEAVQVVHVEELVAAAGRRAAGADPTTALFGLVTDIVAKSARQRHVCDVIAAETGWPRPLLTAAVRRFRRVLGELLAAAQRGGGVRAGLDTADIIAFAYGCASIRSAHPEPARADRMVRLALESLRAPAGVTESGDFRHGGAAGHGTGPRCEECGAPLGGAGRGRPARYCGPACRQRAHRRRVAGRGV
ncbi:TetR/AcrR family transcriptional regulator [Streptomyces sp. NPDC050560]|uniref:TetR/AcrR family transcriptional regulator n=1 Tax=Streptomyces sp. NPDC050560 TaxID=3365630 RepID=UPI0037A8A3FA